MFRVAPNETSGAKGLENWPIACLAETGLAEKWREVDCVALRHHAVQASQLQLQHASHVGMLELYVLGSNSIQDHDLEVKAPTHNTHASIRK